MQALIPLTALGLALLGGGVSTDYSSTRILRTAWKVSVELETTSYSTERDGSPPGHVGTSSEQRTVEETFRVLAQAGGEPKIVRRAFETVRRERTASAFGITGESEEEGPLQGVTLELELEDGEVLVDVVGGQEPDQEATLEGHTLKLAWDGLLPAADAPKQAAWELDPEVILRALALDLEDAYFPLAESTEPADLGSFIVAKHPSVLRELASAEWRGQATQQGEVEHGGETCLEIGLVLKAEGERKATSFGGRGNTVKAKLDGRLLFAREGRHPVLLELKGKVSTELHVEIDGFDEKVTIHAKQEGTLTLCARLSAEERQ